MSKSINELSKLIHENAVSKGFYEGEKNIPELLCLIHSEVSEALEALRIECRVNIENVPDGMDMFKWCVKGTFEDELADIVIRVLDLASYLKIDLEKHIELKMEYNKTRPYKHNKQF